MKHPLDNITKVRYIVGIDLGGTLVNQTAPELLPIPEHIIAVPTPPGRNNCAKKRVGR